MKVPTHMSMGRDFFISESFREIVEAGSGSSLRIVVRDVGQLAEHLSVVQSVPHDKFLGCFESHVVQGDIDQPMLGTI